MSSTKIEGIPEGLRVEARLQDSSQGEDRG